MKEQLRNFVRKIKVPSVAMVCLAAFIMSECRSDPTRNTLPVIPKPLHISYKKGTFKLNENTNFLTADTLSGLDKSVAIFKNEIQAYGDITFKGKEKKARGNVINIRLVSKAGLGDEGYELHITRKRINILAQTNNGIHYGLQSLKQIILCMNTRKHRIFIPALDIVDYPAFKWRGMHLDVSRHFFSVDSIKRYLDFLSLYKFNRFHWHLTDDQGWRIEIEQYPLLTEIGAWRKEKLTGDTRLDSINNLKPLYGGYYTKEEIKDIVAYAKARCITVVPEIEMPGHVQASIAAYPELGVTGKKIEVKRNWGISPNIYNPSEKTLLFLENVLKEVMDLFPSEYIHIGGDEAIKDQWERSEEVQKLILRLEINDEKELQSWFIQQIADFLAKYNKKIIGWDEILEGGIPGNATVMSWRGENGGIEAAKQGHYVIMSPNTYCYLNFSQSEKVKTTWEKRHITDLRKVYMYNPVSSKLKKEQTKYILGAQGCMWTEHLENFKSVEFKLFPRITALSELVWCDPGKKDYPEFTERLKQQNTLFETLKINYCKTDIP